MVNRLIPEWEPQDAIVIAWPNSQTDWKDNLNDVWEFYAQLASEIIDHQKLIILYNGKKPNLPAHKNIQINNCEFNDTWTRDFIGLCIEQANDVALFDYGFNAWGEKFEFNLDNNVNQTLSKIGLFKSPIIDKSSFILEGGSIEVNGKGTLLTTTKCLLNPNRNKELSKKEIESIIKLDLGVEQIIWLENGIIKGDDTDSHIDTLARFCNSDTICYSKGESDELIEMEKELNQLDFNLIPLPLPKPIKNGDNEYPATYANFLITNNKVLCPTYNDDNDRVAINQLSIAFPNRKVIGINALPLIKQNGSLHCVTMQLAKGILK